MDFNPYGGTAARVAAALVNAGSASPADLVEVMRGEGMRITRLTDSQAHGVAEWAKRLGEVFTEPDVHRKVDLVNALLADSACKPFISRHDGRPPHLHYSGEHEDQLRRIQAYTAGGLAHLVCDEPGRMGRCTREGCEVVYVDTSRNGRRRFCSTRCATRVHVAEHRQRKSAS